VRSGKANEFGSEICTTEETQRYLLELLCNMPTLKGTFVHFCREFQMEEAFPAAFERALLDPHDEVKVDPTEYLALSLAPDRVVMVDTEAALEVARRELLSPETSVVGLDAEFTQAMLDNSSKLKPALLQAATRDWAFLFDLTLQSEAVDQLLCELFCSERIRKLGFECVIFRFRYVFLSIGCERQ
jgi:hypothetical protein